MISVDLRTLKKKNEKDNYVNKIRNKKLNQIIKKIISVKYFIRIYDIVILY